MLRRLAGQRSGGHRSGRPGTAVSVSPAWNGGDADVLVCVKLAPALPTKHPYPLGVLLCGHQADSLESPTLVCLSRLCVLTTQGLLFGVGRLGLWEAALCTVCLIMQGHVHFFTRPPKFPCHKAEGS